MDDPEQDPADDQETAAMVDDPERLSTVERQVQVVASQLIDLAAMVDDLRTQVRQLEASQGGGPSVRGTPLALLRLGDYSDPN